MFAVCMFSCHIKGLTVQCSFSGSGPRSDLTVPCSGELHLSSSVTGCEKLLKLANLTVLCVCVCVCVCVSVIISLCSWVIFVYVDVVHWFYGCSFLCLIGCFSMIVWTPTVFECLICMRFLFLYLHLFSAIEHVSHGKVL